MRTKLDLTIHVLEEAHSVLACNVEAISLEEALYVPAEGYRSILGTLKHAAGWSHVYRSYAFDAAPRQWTEIDWPWGLRDTILPSSEYLAGVIAWSHEAHRAWLRDLRAASEDALDAPHPVHWGERRPLFDIVVLIAGHHLYHAGEINQLLSIARGEAWEEGEEVEENHVSTLGHRVRPPWLDRE